MLRRIEGLSAQRHESEGSMNKRICITNNPLWNTQQNGIEFVDGDSWTVFLRARDLIHSGWCFLAHPLYGNFKPLSQPYRTLFLEAPESGLTGQLNMESFTMLERSLEACRACMTVTHAEPSEEMKRDFALLDKSLTEECVDRYLRF